MLRVSASVLAGILLAAVVASAQESRLTESEIETAIKCGKREVKCDRPVLSPGGMMMGILDIEIQVIPPLGRVYLAASDAKEKYRTFARADVTEEMLAPVIEVRARSTDSDMTKNTNVEHIVILPRGKKDGAVQPAKIDAWDYEAKNLVGGSVTRKGKIASFNISDLPPGELDVVLVTDRYGEERAGIKKDDRAKLARWSGTK